MTGPFPESAVIAAVDVRTSAADGRRHRVVRGPVNGCGYPASKVVQASTKGLLSPMAVVSVFVQWYCGRWGW